MIQKCCCLFWVEVENCLKQKCNFILESMEIASNDLLISAQFINLHLWWYMDPLVSMELAPCTSVKASVLKDIRATYAPVQIMSFSGQLESYIRQECDRNW